MKVACLRRLFIYEVMKALMEKLQNWWHTDSHPYDVAFGTEPDLKMVGLLFKRMCDQEPHLFGTFNLALALYPSTLATEPCWYKAFAMAVRQASAVGTLEVHGGTLLEYSRLCSKDELKQTLVNLVA